MLNLLKINFKKYSRGSPDPENYWCDHQQLYNFFPVFVDSGNFQTNFRETKIGRFEGEELAVIEEKKFLIISKGKIFRDNRKNPYW